MARNSPTSTLALEGAVSIWEASTGLSASSILEGRRVARFIDEIVRKGALLDPNEFWDASDEDQAAAVARIGALQAPRLREIGKEPLKGIEVDDVSLERFGFLLSLQFAPNESAELDTPPESVNEMLWDGFVRSPFPEGAWNVSDLAKLILDSAYASVAAAFDVENDPDVEVPQFDLVQEVLSASTVFAREVADVFADGNPEIEVEDVLRFHRALIAWLTPRVEMRGIAPARDPLPLGTWLRQRVTAAVAQVFLEDDWNVYGDEELLIRRLSRAAVEALSARDWNPDDFSGA